MASESIIRGEVGENDRVRVKQRYIESKVYTRKAKRNVSNTISATPPVATDRNTDTNKEAAVTATTTSDTNEGVAVTIPANIRPISPNVTATKDDNTGENVSRNEIPATVAVPMATAKDDSIMHIIPAAITTTDDDDATMNLSTPIAGGTDNENLNATPVATAVTITTNATNEKDNGNDKSNEENAAQVPKLQRLALEDKNLAQLELSSHQETALDNLSSLNKQQVDLTPSIHELAAVNGQVKQGLENRVKINLKSQSKQEKRELREKLESELDMVRSLVRRIEDKEEQLGVAGFSNYRASVSVNIGVNNGVRPVSLELGSLGVPHESPTPISTPTPRKSRPFDQLRVSVMDNSQGLGEIVEKEKRTPKANQLYRNSEFLLAKDKFPPAESNKKSKLNGKKHGGGDLGLSFAPGTKVFKNCSALLEKLMRHKYGWVFNKPVDVVALGLHDYFSIIKHPMDLGTVKSKLNINAYKLPEEFAEDVRLTFHNALRYNPEGHDVHVMANQLLKIFEDRWTVIKSDYDRNMMLAASYHVGYPTPRSIHPPLLRPPPLDVQRILDRSDSIVRHSVDVRSKPMSFTPSARTPAPKKPKAKDPNKRDMTYEEKQKLSTNLQNLPPEKLDSIVQIVKKRNSAVSQNDDEIEVDIDSVDVETLWELDRFVTNYRKNLSKNKRKAELAMLARAEAAQNVQEKGQAQPQAQAPAPIPPVTNEAREMNIDERNISTSTLVQVDKQGDNRSQSSSSGSSSTDSGSSSSDSDSESSSESGSDVGQ